MPLRKIILLTLALMIGVGTFIAFRASQQAPQPSAQADVPITEIIAAARDLPTGTILKDTDMKWVPWASTADTAKLYVKGTADMSSLIGAVLREGLHADEPVIVGRAVQPHEQGFLAAVLTPGDRAVSIALTPSAEVSGFIFPGDRVDVIMTHSFSRKDSYDYTERHVSETIITDVRVLALDQKSDNQTVEPKIATTATLEVTPKQAEKLTLAVDLIGGANGGHGTLSLALRSLATDGSVPTATVSAEPAAASSTAKDNAPVLTLPLAAPVAAPTPTLTPASSPPVAGGPTWDSDISPAFPTVNGDDGLMQRVQIMRGKNSTEITFDRHR